MRKLWDNFNYETPSDQPSGGEPVEPETTEEAWAPSQEEFTQIKESVQQLTGLAPTVQQMQQILQRMQEPEVEEDEEDFDIGRYIHEQVQQAIAPMVPIVTSAAQKSGQERMKELFAQQEKELKVKFDHELAERAATHFYNETGDPVKAVQEGAKYAAEYRKREREDAIKEYQESLKRGPQNLDPAVEGGGDRSVPKAKTYDEVVERWAGQTEV